MTDLEEKELKNINVHIRIRPQENSIRELSCLNVVSDTQISTISKDQVEKNYFTFDRVFNPQTTQQYVYQTVAEPIINKNFEGINGTIFCYGQTSSGKTYTCIGPDFKDQKKMGLLPRIIREMLSRIKKRPKNIESNIKMAMIEIYNQKIIDLLNPKKKHLKIRSNKSQGIFLDGVTEKYILSESEAFYYLNKGINCRSTASTNMNKISSRSHMMFLITLHQHDFYTGQAKSARFTLADLAGSQKVSKTGSQGKALQQAKKINTSLTALSKVIHALSEGKNGHIPYRDSKLTRLLQESLGGNSITNLIINVSQDFINQFETVMSLRFGNRAKQIKNEPKVNKQYTVSELLSLLGEAEKKIKEQGDMISQLKRNSHSFHNTDEISSLSMIVKEEECSSEEQSNELQEKFHFDEKEEQDFPWNFNQSTKSFEDWEDKNNLSPLRSCKSIKKLDRYLSPKTKDIKLQLSMNRKFSLRDLQLTQKQSQSSFSSKMEIHNQVVSFKAEPQLKSSQVKDFTIEQNIERIKMNLKAIKEKHLYGMKNFLVQQ